MPFRKTICFRGFDAVHFEVQRLNKNFLLPKGDQMLFKKTTNVLALDQNDLSKFYT